MISAGRRRAQATGSVALCRGLIGAGCVGIVLATAVFLLWPGLDFSVSRWFYQSETGFPVAHARSAVALRWIFRTTAHLVFVGAILLLIFDLLRRNGPSARRTDLIFASFVYVLGPGLVANLGLKAFWGRARPRDIVEFGGNLRYSPFWQPSDQCSVDCSFVSGEATIASAAALVLLLIWLPRLGCVGRRVGVGAATLFVLAASMLRLIFGAHFLSDITFGGLFMLVLVPAAYLLVMHSRLADGRAGP